MDTPQHPRRPERVIILDADDPMVEIEGRIVWQEAHDRIVVEVQAAAFRDGYLAGRRDAVTPVRVQVGRRRGPARWVWLVVWWGVALMVLLVLPELLR